MYIIQIFSVVSIKSVVRVRGIFPKLPNEQSFLFLREYLNARYLERRDKTPARALRAQIEPRPGKSVVSPKPIARSSR